MTRMTLKNVTSGRVDKPYRILLYGWEGVGKSTFASDSPSPIYLCAEDGTAQLDVARFPEPTNWDECLEAVDVLSKEKHDYKTLVIDTIDWLEPLLWTGICSRDGKKSIEAYGYGKGYTAALDEWRVLIAKLEQLQRAKSMNLIMLGHSQIKMFRNPEGDDYDRYSLKIHEKAAGAFREWSDAVLYACYETFVDERDNGKSKGVSTGKRVLKTERHAAYDAKNRYGLPQEIPLQWGEFVSAVNAGEPVDPNDALKEIEQLTCEWEEDKRGKVADHIKAAANDGQKLAKLLNWVRSK